MADVHEFFTRQHEHLNRVETSIVKTQTELDAARKDQMDSLRAKRAEAAAIREDFQQKMAVPVNKMKASVDSRRAETQATVEEWKRKREVSKLDRRAQDLEDYADAAMSVLDIAQEEARQASLDAIEARRVADEAKAGATA
jgi:uncharacterized protein YhaN